MSLAEFLAVSMVVAVIAALMAGYPVSLTLAGVSLIFACSVPVRRHGLWILGALPQRIFGVMTNDVLLAIPLFIFMGVCWSAPVSPRIYWKAWPGCSARCAAGWDIRRSSSAHCSRRRPALSAPPR